jgi:hypothetical protein
VWGDVSIVKSGLEGLHWSTGLNRKVLMIVI